MLRASVPHIIMKRLSHDRSTSVPLILFIFTNTFLRNCHAYEVGCMYPERMLEPFAARAKLTGFTNVYNVDTELETPVSVHQAQAFSYCDINCLAHHDDGTLNAFTKARPTIVVPKFGHNSWSRMLCIAQCYSILFEQAGNSEAVETVRDTWKLDILSKVEEEITEKYNVDYRMVQDYIISLDYDPLAIGRLVLHEINMKFSDDGWNSNGSKRYDPYSKETVPCSTNCIPYRDTYGYYPRNFPMNPNEQIERVGGDKYTVSGNEMFWQPLLEDDGNGYLSRQEHVTPHIGFHAQARLRDPVQYNFSLPDPQYDFYQESLQVIERVKESAMDKMKWDKIAFYDKKFLVRILIQEEIIKQFKGTYKFEDELLFVHAIGAAEHDSVLHAWREKVMHDLVRPTTVIQRWGQDEITTFDGNRKDPGIATINANDFHAFIRVMPHSEYPSGSSCICAAYHEFTDIFTHEYFEKNLTDMFWGYGGIDLGCSELSVLDPARADFLGCKQGGFTIPNMDALAKECGESRLWGGMHFTASVPAGRELCTGIGSLAFEYMQMIRNGSSLCEAHVKGDDRPQCSTTTSTPTNSPSAVTLAPSISIASSVSGETEKHSSSPTSSTDAKTESKSTSVPAHLDYTFIGLVLLATLLF
mmetsp:Transcript_20520/g.23543  ORF Transcript_20520/g.23543 Transcript_20520/m.23543 type:complete len:642 (+) Transcript_20520:44-1969(+)